MTFNSKDINEFLMDLDYPEWNGDVLDSQTGKQRKATSSDFDYSGVKSSTTLAFNYKGSLEVKDMTITDFQFVTYSYDSDVMGSGETQHVDKNYSTQWTLFLLNKYREVYAKKLFDWSINNMSRIEKIKKDAISHFIKQENEKHKQALELYSTWAELSMRYLPPETVDNLNL